MGCSLPYMVRRLPPELSTLRILRSFYRGLSHEGLVQGVIHCFQGDMQFARGCLELGFYLGVDGPISYPNARELREVLGQVSLERLVLETDSPYLPPQSHRGKRNEPAYLAEIAQKVADLRGTSLEEVSEVTSRNARRLFKLGDTP